MRGARYAAAAVLGAIIAASAPTAFAALNTPPKPVFVPERTSYIKPIPATEDAAVRINLDGGLGSGVSIGKGYIVTAAHVVAGQKEVKVTSRLGKESPAAVLWVNADYDIALLRTKASLPAAEIDCNTAHVGSTISTVGNPLGIEFISSFGRIAGAPREMAPKWRSAFVTDLTVIMGNSGGPVFSDAGRLVGIVVGVLGVPNEAGAKSYLGLSMVVPSSVVCELMGRAK